MSRRRTFIWNAEEDEAYAEVERRVEREVARRERLEVSLDTRPDATCGSGTENRFTDSIMDSLPGHIQRTIRIRLSVLR